MIISRGFGSALVFKIAVSLGFGFLLWVAVKNQDWLAVGATVLSLFIAIIFWPVVYLHGYWACTIFTACAIRGYWSLLGRNVSIGIGISGAFLAMWLLQSSDLGSWTHLPVIGIAVFLVLAFTLMLLPRWPLLLLGSGCILITIYGMYPAAKGKNVGIKRVKNIASNYSHGTMLCRVLEGSIVDQDEHLPGTLISNLYFDQEPDSATNKILLNEHDVHASKEHPYLKSRNLSQAKPWTGNQFFGNQYLLSAIAKDGVWISNLGGSLDFKGRLLLASNSHHGGEAYEPLVVSYENRTYVNDSDPFVDRFAAYQVNTINEIVKKPWFPRLINIIFVIGILLGDRRWSLVSLIVGTLLFVSVNLWPNDGDVRLIADRGSPHEMSKVGGVIRSLVDAGFNYIPGDKNTRIAIVGPDRNVTASPTERVIVGSSGSRIVAQDDEIRVGNVPLGSVNGIMDARNLYLNGNNVGPMHSTNGVLFIGTDSPAKIEWSKCLKH